MTPYIQYMQIIQITRIVSCLENYQNVIENC